MSTYGEIDLRNIAAVWAAYGRHIATAVGGRCEVSEDIVMCWGGYTSPFRNMAIPLRSASRAEWDKLEKRLLDFYGSKSGWTVFCVFPDDLHELGFHIATANPIMVRSGQECAVIPQHNGFSIQEIENDEDVITFEQIRESAYGNQPPAGDSTDRYFDSRVLGQGYRLWLCKLHGRSVATAGLFESDTFSMVKNVSTLAEYRGRGIGTIMSARAIKACGVKKAILDSEPLAHNIYARLGFTEVGTLNFWQHNP